MIKTKVFLKVLFPYKSFFTKHVLILTVLVLAAARLPISHLTSETNTNSLVVNEELMYHAMHTGEDYGGTKTNFLEVNSTNFLEVYDELFKVL